MAAGREAPGGAVDDVDLYELNGIVMVRANNRGVSLYTLKGVEDVGLTGWAWRIRQGTALPPELKLHNDKPEHYMICPISEMPLAKFVGLLQQMVVHCEKYFSGPWCRQTPEAAMSADVINETFVRTEVRTLLRCLVREERRLEKMTLGSDDDDDVTDAVNDLAALRLLLNRLRRSAVETFGPSIADFSFESTEQA